jgi:hypothetical protein
VRSARDGDEGAPSFDLVPEVVARRNVWSGRIERTLEIKNRRRNCDLSGVVWTVRNSFTEVRAFADELPILKRDIGLPRTEEFTTPNRAENSGDPRRRRLAKEFRDLLKVAA